ncbi:hypothetical protein AJ88_03095 [Mesorhizobium amorphae CCBAU 01583]|nr:hypothetical protein AJ88_03095 [Mesorhizobium amorphae CCBAU 01583]
MILIVAGLVLWQRFGDDLVRPGDVALQSKMALPLPDKPSVAVLPFTNMSTEAGQEHFADGMTDDLITDLSKVPASS